MHLYASQSPKKSIGFAAEYVLAALLAIVFVYTLTISHSYSAPFTNTTTRRTHWWKARLDAPAWLEQHEQYVSEASAAFASQVGSTPAAHNSFIDQCVTDVSTNANTKG